MALNKKDAFDERDVLLAAFAKTLSHPARIAILRVLAEQQTCICGEIVEVLPLAQATVSQHLKELKAMGLVKGEVEGTKSCYCIDWDRLAELYMLLHAQFQTFLQLRPKDGGCCK